MSTKTSVKPISSLPTPPRAPMLKTVAKKTAIQTAPAKTKAQDKDSILAALHLRIVRRDYALRPVETSVQFERIVGVPKEHVRPLTFGCVKPAKCTISPVEEALWARVRNGPSALEHPAVRKAIAKGDFKLRSVQTRVNSRPVVVDQEHQALVRELRSFLEQREAKLKHVEPRVSYKPVLLPPTLNSAQKAAIARFPEAQLHHVCPRVKHTPIVDAENKEATLLRSVAAFDRKALRHVEPKVSHAAVVDAPKETIKPAAQPQEKPAKAKADIDLKKVVENVEALTSLGFTDKKASFQLLVKNGNDLVTAVETLLDTRVHAL